MRDDAQELDWKHHAMAAVDPKRGLWRLVISPVIAALHFTVVYIGTSVACMRPGGNLDDVRLVMGLGTVLVVAAIGFCAWIARRRLRLVRRARAGASTSGEELEFLSRITLYLANLSWVGVLFVASPLAFFGSCG